ncbi:MAG TPA: AraC family transcriptional regulator [Solirubrobacteraceae bacterium]|jgi:AraC-like DNA-binding protein|nr:AraC family transcriptional regulator [Solirubrobacteraceae bacterium]
MGALAQAGRAVAPPEPRRFADRVRIGTLPELAVHHPGPRAVPSTLVLLVEAGSGRYRQGAIAAKATAGSAFLTAPGELHDLGGLWSVRGWVIEFPVGVVGMAARADGRFRPHGGHPGWLSFIRPTCLSGRLDLDPATTRRWVLRTRSLSALLAERPVGYNQSVAAYLTLMLIDAARVALPGLGGPAQREAPLLQAAFDHIEAAFHTGISLDGVARRVGVSPGHLARVFKRTTGRTVNEWIAERRMVEARRRLLATDEKVEAVARSCGFADASYFRRRFRAMHGASPAAWRQAHRAAAAATAGRSAQ